MSPYLITTFINYFLGTKFKVKYGKTSSISLRKIKYISRVLVAELEDADASSIGLATLDNSIALKK